MLLRDVFEQFKGRRFLFVEPGGNHGDFLIYAGARKLATDVGLDFYSFFFGSSITPLSFFTEITSELEIVDSDIIYLHGSGGFSSTHGWSPFLLQILRNMFSKNLIIVGPSSAELDSRYFERVLPQDENIIFFAREKITYSFMKNFFSKTYLDHDTALHLTKDCDEFKSFSMGVPIKDFHQVLILRDDLESVPLPRSIQKKEFKIICDPVYLTRREWLKLHLWASKITTNRCHSAILGSILGKEVNLYANSYHKNFGIWDFSLKKQGVGWIPHQYKFQLLINYINYLQKLFGSWKQNTFFTRTHLSLFLNSTQKLMHKLIAML